MCEGKPGCVSLEGSDQKTFEIGAYVEANAGPGAPIDTWVRFGKPRDNEGSAAWLWIPDIEAGLHYLRGVSQCPYGSCGYTGSETTATIPIVPGNFPEEPTYSELPNG
jgi:hypothetical protein